MHIAATQHCLHSLSSLLAGGGNINATDERGRTPLHAACGSFNSDSKDSGRNCTKECIKNLLSSGASENARDANGQTSLHVAASTGNVDAVQVLLAAGATEIVDFFGNSPLHLAAAQGYLEIMQLLILGNQADNIGTCSSLTMEKGVSEVKHIPKKANSYFPEGVSREQKRPLGKGFNHTFSGKELNVSRHLQHRKHASERGKMPTEAPVSYIYNLDPRKPQVFASSKRQPKKKKSITTRYRGSASDGDLPASLVRPGSHLATSSVVRSIFVGKESCGGHDLVVGADEVEHFDIISRESDETLAQEDCRAINQMPVIDGSESTKEIWRSWNTHVHQPHNLVDSSCLWKEAVGQYQHGEFEDENATRDTNKNREDDNDRDDCPIRVHVRRKHTRRWLKEIGKRKQRRPCRRPSNKNDIMAAWPELLSPSDHEQTILGSENKEPGVLQYAAFSAGLFAACLASRYNDAAALLNLLESQGGRVGSLRDEEGRTLLHCACRRGDTKMARLLCRAGADPDARDCQGHSPLMLAAATGRTGCLRLFLRGGADPHSCDNNGNTLLHVAVWNGNLSCAQVLVANGAVPSKRNKLGFTPRESILNTSPGSSRGRLPDTLRETLEYIEGIEVQSLLPTWTAEEHYGSETTATIAPSPLGIDCDRDRKLRHVELQSKGRISGQWETGEVFCGKRRNQNRRGFATRESLAKNGNMCPVEHIPRQNYSYSSRAAHPFSRSLISQSRTQPNTPHHEYWSVEDGPITRESKKQVHLASIAADYEPRTIQCDLRQGTHINISPNITANESSKTHGSQGKTFQREPPADPVASSKVPVKRGVWNAFRRALDYLIGGENWSSCQENFEPGRLDGISATKQSFGQGKSLRPPNDQGLRARTTITSTMEPTSVLGAKATRATSTDTLVSVQQSILPPGRMPFFLTPMQPPPDVIAAMRGRATMGKRRRRLWTPSAEIAVALEKARTAKAYEGGVCYGGDRATRNCAEHD